MPNASHPPVAEPSGAKAERMRATILAAATDLFSKRGFASAKLEEVADAVGVTRAALFYYFRDKQALFDAVVTDAFHPLAEQLEKVLAPERGSIGARILLATETWVDYVIARPAVARLILRLVADGPQLLSHGVFSDNDQLPMKAMALFAEGRRSGEINPPYDDPFHIASAIIGTTVFYVAALGILVPHDQYEPLDPEQAAGHKREALRAARQLLGITEVAAPRS